MQIFPEMEIEIIIMILSLIIALITQIITIQIKSLIVAGIDLSLNS